MKKIIILICCLLSSDFCLGMQKYQVADDNDSLANSQYSGENVGPTETPMVAVQPPTPPETQAAEQSPTRLTAQQREQLVIAAMRARGLKPTFISELDMINGTIPRFVPNPTMPIQGVLGRTIELNGDTHARIVGLEIACTMPRDDNPHLIKKKIREARCELSKEQFLAYSLLVMSNALSQANRFLFEQLLSMQLDIRIFYWYNYANRTLLQEWAYQATTQYKDQPEEYNQFGCMLLEAAYNFAGRSRGKGFRVVNDLITNRTRCEFAWTAQDFFMGTDNDVPEWIQDVPHVRAMIHERAEQLPHSSSYASADSSSNVSRVASTLQAIRRRSSLAALSVSGDLPPLPVPDSNHRGSRPHSDDVDRCDLHVPAEEL